jgi:DNA-binding NarL/FixJ family response regulator
MIRIFLAEDHVMVRDGLRRLLGTAAMNLVGEASTGDEALRAIRGAEVDVVLLDLDLPGRSGFEVLDELKSLPKPPKVIILTGHQEDELAIRCIRAGADGFVSKNRDIHNLADAVRRVHGGGKYLSADLAELIALNLDGSREPPRHERLTHREFEVMCRLAKGESVSDVGASLFLSPKTVGTYRRRLLDKLKLRNNAELTQYALKEGLIE